ncbi:biotin carboxyl carrier domain-containing protein [Oceanobacillus sp. 143]|jgi:acetyl-CoA carboxylase biotin carboxyl carrier protein|uniref:Biotin carboxyl carrier protein of acetyl-CoA carboxylase n=1 Tax=Oceanobacillus zhaokaii TaxID=2052660 RepID=A0A345PK12_9BACI|nr:acetyl-CoA carboxylase [Oceanobacillus zhaokaii]AXI10342.1 acetyl-CoA carboxylase biotin carboxyl carrier protein subunit [Oceanobacillus zhaokaii]QGS69386.1 biotin carboxyl carrier domain-containing protein [Oceanobacillus sp. 143]
MSQSKVVSPIPGVFYRKPSPEEDVYVNEGDTVSAGQVIGLVEVMKSYFEIKAEDDGVIESFAIEHEDSIDAGQEIAIINAK